MEVYFLMVLIVEIFIGIEIFGDLRIEIVVLRYCVISVWGKKELNWFVKINVWFCKKGVFILILLIFFNIDDILNVGYEFGFIWLIKKIGDDLIE